MVTMMVEMDMTIDAEDSANVVLSHQNRWNKPVHMENYFEALAKNSDEGNCGTAFIHELIPDKSELEPEIAERVISTHGVLA